MTDFFFGAVSAVVYPLPAGLGLLILAALALWRRRRLWVAVCLALALLTLGLPSLPVVSVGLRGSLEQRYPPSAAEDLPQRDVIVVLGGFVGGPIPPRLTSNLTAASDRVRHAAHLFAAGKAPLIVASGGGPPDAASEASLIADLLVEFGVPRNAILIEAESRTTYENARFTRVLLEQRGPQTVLLVTSALHMPRALATFRAAGVDVVAAPTDFEIVEEGIGWLPDAEALEGSTRAIKEYLGMVVYRWRGWM